MHIGWLGGHFDDEYTPWAQLCRAAANASFSVIRLPSRRKMASMSATSPNVRPRTRSEPCSTTAARSASRCSAAQRAASSAASTRSSGGLSGRTSTLSSEVGNEDAISIPFFRCCSRCRQQFWRRSEPIRERVIDQRGQIGENRVISEVLERHGTVQGNRQLQCRQRRAAQVEEVIPSADLLLRDAEHLCPCSRQLVLGRRGRSVGVVFGDI